MKFYYNGKLVRTSKTHYYTHAVMTADNRLISCASSYELAQKSMLSNTATERDCLGFYKEELKNLKLGRNSFWYKNRKCFVKHDAELLEVYIKQIEDYLKGLHIVKLTAR